jgi:peptidyl-prolyl cis-trans isomerase A (cyclophilin A)
METFAERTQDLLMLSRHLNLALFGLLNCFLIGALCSAAGCSEQNEDEPRSVLDSISEVEKAKKDLDVPIVYPKPVMPGRPSEKELDETAAPAQGSYSVKFESSVGDFVILVHRDWAPAGAQRFYDLVKSGFYDDCRFFRVVKGFMVQFGINGDPGTQQSWERSLRDDPRKRSNRRGYITFATSGPDSRTTQVFINFVDNAFLDAQGFSPFGEVIEGMDVVDKINDEHGENPDQGQITAGGNAYLKAQFPNLDFIKKATIIEE